MDKIVTPVFVEVTGEPVSSNSYVKDGKPAVLRRQKIYFHQGEGYPLPAELVLRDTAAPYQPGRYLLGGEVFRNGVRASGNGTGKGYVQVQFSDMDLHLIPLERAIAILTGTDKPAKAA